WHPVDVKNLRPAIQNACPHGPVGSARHSSSEDGLFASRDFSPATSRRPSRENARPPNRSAWVASVKSCWPVPRCQRLIVLSSPSEVRVRPSGAKARRRTAPACPEKVSRKSPDKTSQTRIIPSEQAAARAAPWGENTTALTASPCSPTGGAVEIVALWVDSESGSARSP